MKTRRPWPLVLLVSLMGCNFSTYDEVQGAVTYAQVPSPREPGGVHPLTLDIEVPDGAGPFPTLVFLHGGGWVAGDLRAGHLPERLVEARQHGFVALSIAYRRADHDDGHGQALHPWPAQLQDVRCALRWLAANAAQYKVDTSRVGLWGNSAGGQLAMMAVYARDEARYEPTDCPWSGDVQVKAVLTTSGVSDPTSVYETTEWWLKPFIARWLALPDGARVQDAPEAFAQANPLTFLPRAPHVPALLLHGTRDTLVPPVTQTAFTTSARLLGQDVRVEWLEGAVHDLDASHRAEVDARTWSWFGETL